jgi:uncharacterized protein YbbC (DUF1343 family)
MSVRAGLDRLLSGDADQLPLVLSGKRVGLIANPTSVDAGLRHAADLLPGRFRLTALLGPEHGLRGEAQDMVGVHGGRDSRTGLPVHSLYGHTAQSLAPSDEALGDVDVLLYDIQDVGCRYYTFPWTLLLCLRAAARAGIRVVVLDRPNPLGGQTVEGAGVDEGYASFVGLHSVPVRHGLTVGELARLVARREGLLDALTVVPMEGWRRSMHFDQTGLPWVQPSPNMPTLETAFVYPGMCLLEGTELSEGRGTTRPFEIFGAPYLDGERLARALGDEDLPGVTFRPLSFRPTFHKHAAQVCGGLQVHVTDRDRFRPLLTGVAILRAVRRLHPSEFRWREQPYEFVTDRPAIDLLGGGPRLREHVERGTPLPEIASEWRAAEDAFRDERRASLLYD